MHFALGSPKPPALIRLEREIWLMVLRVMHGNDVDTELTLLMEQFADILQMYSEDVREPGWFSFFPSSPAISSFLPDGTLKQDQTLVDESSEQGQVGRRAADVLMRSLSQEVQGVKPPNKGKLDLVDPASELEGSSSEDQRGQVDNLLHSAASSSPTEGWNEEDIRFSAPPRLTQGELQGDDDAGAASDSHDMDIDDVDQIVSDSPPQIPPQKGKANTFGRRRRRAPRPIKSAAGVFVTKSNFLKPTTAIQGDLALRTVFENARNQVSDALSPYPSTEVTTPPLEPENIYSGDGG